MIRTFLRRLFCRHTFAFHRNVYGDEINLIAGKRSLWWCTACGAVQARGELHRPSTEEPPRPQEHPCDGKDPRSCWNLRSQLGKTCTQQDQGKTGGTP